MPVLMQRLTPLHLAASTGLETVCASLVQRGANINAVDEAYETPLMKAVSFGFEAGGCDLRS